MDLSQLKTLIQVAETGSLLKASERLGIAQPALSRKVRQLEDELGVLLFQRHGRGMVLTPFGVQAVSRARAILAEIAALRQDADGHRHAPIGEVVLGLPPNVAEFLTAPLLRRVGELHPSVRLRFVSAYSGHLQEWLVRGDVDVAVHYEQDNLPSLNTRPLVSETLYYVAAASKGLRRDIPFAFAQIAHERLVLPSSKHRLRQVVDKAAEALGIRLHVVHEADDLLTVRDVIASGVAGSVLPFPAIHAQVTQGLLCAAPIVDPKVTRRLDIAFASVRPLDRIGREVCDVVIEEIRGLVDRAIWDGEMCDVGP